ncbi:MAG: hypothetical protein CENE_00937 [Candidatus Celerinatantimonas neptuna]|nr:MAG: hypothetical protein CENE_00937 [Candidatus Celerinatantimonas neptuna]
MFTIPLPFAITLIFLLSVILFFRSLRCTQIIFFISIASLELIIGIRWAWNCQWHWLRILHLLIQAPIPALIWFCCLPPKHNSRLNWLHVLGPLLLFVSYKTRIFGPISADITMILICLIYSIAIFYIAICQQYRYITDMNLDEFMQNRPMLFACGGLFIISSFLEIALCLDMLETHGKNIISIFTIGHWLLFIPLGSIIFLTSKQDKTTDKGFTTAASSFSSAKQSQAVTSSSTPTVPLTTQTTYSEPAENKINDINRLSILKDIRQLMDETKIYRDPNLTLKTLARKLGIPMRKISEAINQHTHQNVSQFINQYRIEYAKQQLTTSSSPITEIFMDAGFYTKSNFNREFLRITQQTPSDYRRLSLHDHE